MGGAGVTKHWIDIIVADNASKDRQLAQLRNALDEERKLRKVQVRLLLFFCVFVGRRGKEGVVGVQRINRVCARKASLDNTNA